MSLITLYPVMVLTCLRGIFHRTLKAVQLIVSSWMSNGGLRRSGYTETTHLVTDIISEGKRRYTREESTSLVVLESCDHLVLDLNNVMPDTLWN